MRKQVRFVLALLLAGSLLVWVGCFGDKDNHDNGDGICDVNCELAKARAELENILFDLDEGEDPEHPEDIDFTSAYDHYMAALSMESNNPDANFGAGILEVVMLTQDPQIQEFFDRVEAFVDSGRYFESGSELSMFEGPLRISGPVVGLNRLCIPLATPARMMAAFTRIQSHTDPTVEELQQICVSEVLPRIDACISRLVKVTADRDFTFIVTAKMQGDLEEDPVELDLTEVYTTLAGLYAVRAGLYHFVAYDFNLAEYTGEEMLAALTPGSSFGSLRPGGATKMQSALEDWKSAVSYLDLGVDFLESEADFQGDDFIYIDPYDDFTRADLDTIKRYLPIALNILNTSDEITLDWDGKESTPDETIEFSLASFYGTPVEDLKTLLPLYTVSLDSMVADTRSVSEDTSVQATVNIASSDYYTWQRSASFEDGEMDHSYEYTDIDVPEWDAAWNSYVARAMDKPYASVSAYFSEYLSPGAHDVQCEMHFYFDEPTRSRYIPVVTWEADSFEEWVLPDPTLGGLLPGMTNDRLKQIFAIDGEDWEKTSRLEIW